MLLVNKSSMNTFTVQSLLLCVLILLFSSTNAVFQPADRIVLKSVVDACLVIDTMAVKNC
mgnify:CR=1 FL=1